MPTRGAARQPARRAGASTRWAAARSTTTDGNESGGPPRGGPPGGAGPGGTGAEREPGELWVCGGRGGAAPARAAAWSSWVPGLFPPITINGRRYIDGGMRSGTNADLAKGHERVLIITLMTGARTTA